LCIKLSAAGGGGGGDDDFFSFLTRIEKCFHSQFEAVNLLLLLRMGDERDAAACVDESQINLWNVIISSCWRGGAHDAHK
jgi:hypothetical protein